MFKILLIAIAVFIGYTAVKNGENIVTLIKGFIFLLGIIFLLRILL